MHHPNCRLKVNTSTTITWTMSIHEWFWKCNYFMIDWSMINVCKALTIHTRYSQLCTQNDFEMLICIFFHLHLYRVYRLTALFALYNTVHCAQKKTSESWCLCLCDLIYLQGTLSAFNPGKPPLCPPSIYVPNPGVIGAQGGLPILETGPFVHLAAQTLTIIAIKNVFWKRKNPPRQKIWLNFR